MCAPGRRRPPSHATAEALCARERERTSRPMAPKADKERAAAAAKKIEDKTFGMKNKNKVPRDR